MRSGSCRDSAWLLVHLFRHIGIAARFVSGYLIQLKPMSNRSTARRGRSMISPIFTPGRKFICRARDGLVWTPLPGLLAGEGHIPLACSPDPTGAAPVTGAVDECETEVHP